MHPTGVRLSNGSTNACAGRECSSRARYRRIYMTQSLALLDFLQPRTSSLALAAGADRRHHHHHLRGGLLIVACPVTPLLFITGLFIAQGFIDTLIWLAATCWQSPPWRQRDRLLDRLRRRPKLFSRPDSRLFC